MGVTAEAATFRESFLAKGLANRWARRGIAFGTGALLNLAFAPYELWPLAIVCPAILMLLWEGARPREAAALGFWFNFATFLFGTWWIYTGVHTMAAVPAWIALFLLFGLTSIMAAYHAGLGYVVTRWLPASGALRWLVALPAAWVFVEWWRGWFLSGFMWLSLGYTQTDTWLANLAPVVGVYGISAVLLLGSGALVALIRGNMRTRAIAVAVLLVPWIAAAPLGRIEWTQPSGKPVAVAIVQGAIPQDEKWAKDNEANVLRIYRGLAEQAFGTPVIVLPEASLPPIANEIMDYLVSLYRDAEAKGSALVLGILRAKINAEGTAYSDYYNSVLALDLKATDELQWYDKHHLVPFTEFFPVPKIVRSWMLVMNLPYSDFTRGALVQPALRAGGLRMSASICYEDGYGSAYLEQLKSADTLVNVTNDAWFGHGSARYLHFQIARMRAIEAQRFMLRAGNDGISAVIGPKGEIVAEAPGFQPYVLRSEVTPRMGLPPYARVGNWLVVLLASVGVILGLAAAFRTRRAAQ